MFWRALQDMVNYTGLLPQKTKTTMTEKYWPQHISPTRLASAEVSRKTPVRMEQVQIHRRSAIRVIDEQTGEILKGFRSRARANAYLKDKTDAGEYALRFGNSIAVQSLDYDFLHIPGDYRSRFFYVLCYCLAFTYLAYATDSPILYFGTGFFLLGCLYEVWNYLQSERLIARHGLTVERSAQPKTNPLRLLIVIAIGYGLSVYGLVTGQFSLDKVALSVDTMPELYWISIAALLLIASSALWRLARLYWNTGA